VALLKGAPSTLDPIAALASLVDLNSPIDCNPIITRSTDDSNHTPEIGFVVNKSQYNQVNKNKNHHDDELDLQHQSASYFRS